VLGNVCSHWLLGLHRVVRGDAATPLEVALFALGVVLLAVGARRELAARRRGLKR
jgi:hypothetical protein